MAYPRGLGSPPPIFATVVAAADGAPVLVGVAAKYSTGAGAQAAGGGTCQHEGNGQWSYTPTQAETNVDGFGIQFYHMDAVGDGPTVSVITGVMDSAGRIEVSGTKNTLDSEYAALEALIATVTAKTNLITAGGSVTVVAPVDAGGDASIDAGYDYYDADGRALSWTDETPATWPNLTGATATLYVGSLAVVGTITTPAGPATIKIELTRVQTATLAAGVHPFHVDITLANTHLILQIRGTLTVS